MADKILNTRIQLKHDTLSAWQTKNTLLKKGEIAIAVIEGIDPANKLHQPVMFKVGPGNFNNLDWASALAADVYAWAKKPTLDANDLPEIPGLKLGIAFEIVGEGNAITNVSYSTENKKFTFTKGETFATKKELEDVVANGTVVVEGAVIDVAQDGNTYTVSHEAITKPTETAGSGRKYLTDVTTDGYGHITGFTTAEEEDQDLSGYKTKQTAVVDPTASGETLAFIDSISQNENGEITATKKSVALGDYAKTADVPSIKVNNAGTADKVANELTVGSKKFDGSAAVEVTAADLGLESAMHFVGAFATAPDSAVNGDVYLNTANKKEYVYSNGWVELGDEGSYALRTVTITGNEGLTGGGDLTTNRTIGIADKGVTLAKLNDEVKEYFVAQGHLKGNYYTAEKTDELLGELGEQIEAKQEQFATITKSPDGEAVLGVSVVASRAAFEMPADGEYAIKLSTPGAINFFSESKVCYNGEEIAIKSELPTVNDGKFTVSGTGALTGSGEMTANQAGNTTATLDLTDEVKGQINGAVQTVTAGVGIKAVKTGTGVNLEIVGKDETDEDGNTVTWIFDCGGAE